MGANLASEWCYCREYIVSGHDPHDHSRERVECTAHCGAFEEPETLDEYKLALLHAKDHESDPGGCSHGR